MMSCVFFFVIFMGNITVKENRQCYSQSTCEQNSEYHKYKFEFIYLLSLSLFPFVTSLNNKPTALPPLNVLSPSLFSFVGPITLSFSNCLFPSLYLFLQQKGTSKKEDPKYAPYLTPHWLNYIFRWTSGQKQFWPIQQSNLKQSLINLYSFSV